MKIITLYLLKIINNKMGIAGPSFPEFEGVPMPIGIPFGIFKPINRQRLPVPNCCNKCRNRSPICPIWKWASRIRKRDTWMIRNCEY